MRDGSPYLLSKDAITKNDKKGIEKKKPVNPRFTIPIYETYMENKKNKNIDLPTNSKILFVLLGCCL